MNKEQVTGRTDQLKGHLKETWGKLTDDELKTYEGKRDAFFGSVKEKYGTTKEDAEKQISAFTDKNKDNDNSLSETEVKPSRS